ncbi:alpha/beta fold hydrolase [Streptomyces sp. W1SF4]|uniref:alpha/beta fold hydrolase n=1 Tax=Streptomyces sp. W1SF4 TaxID=2305220 RepID=UPI000F6D5BE7|nr:alpha/beta fold hydrolase [Streptomyces sp. W1SF4]AZM87992.1 alpha/beta fold hydrolase [Streptomyces sp. W1SF4]
MTKHTLHAAAATAALACLPALGPAQGTTAGAPAQPAGAGRPAAPSARFVPGPCPKTPEPVEALSTARCGYLEVPENRARPDGRTIRLAVAVIRSVRADPAPDPVVFMAGGPGADTFDDIPFLIGSGLNKDRELIVMAQRGNLHDQPNLACPEVDRANEKTVAFGWDAPEARQLLLKAFKECRERLTADGTDLSAYNTTENAADFADLRTALGIAQWNVYGYSYGSNLGLTYLRLHPEGIRALAVDSLSPPQVTILPWGWRSAREGLDAVLGACAAQPACKSRYPGLDETLDAQVAELEANPLTLDARPPGEGKPVKVVLDGGTLLNTMVGSNVKPVDIPAALEELGRGDPRRFAQGRAKDSVQPTGLVAHGLTQSVACAEWVPGTSEPDVLAAGREAFPGWPRTVLAQTPQLPFEYEVCKVWNVADNAARHRVATVSSVPALVISGTFDMKTGASYAKDASRTLSRSTSVLIPGIGHWVVPQSKCAQQVLASFLARPAAPDTGCVAGLAPAPFTITPK